MDRAMLRDILLTAQDDAHRVPLDSVALEEIDQAIEAAVVAVAAGVADGCLTRLMERVAEAVRGSVPDAWFEDEAFDHDIWAVDAIACALEDLLRA